MLDLRSEDTRFMQRALELAEQGRGAVEPNPLVGAVVVQNQQIVGEGRHARFGGPHAEVAALASAGDDSRGATLYVTLEPCCHHGKTPPCTDAIVRAGISRVVAALRDPYPEVAGGGFQRLREAGVETVSGLLEPEARRLNAPYLKRLETGTPYVHAKWAMTWDGKIASCSGQSKWISGEASRREVHALRGRMDGILVGLGTVLADDPLLTARPPGPRTAVRIVLDSRAGLPQSSQLVRTARDVPVLVAVSPSALDHDVSRLRQAGCEVALITAIEDRAVIGNRRTNSGVCLRSLLVDLGRRGMTNLLVEGGAGVLGSFFDAQLVDAVHVFLAPKLLGGASAKSPVGGRGWPQVASAWGVENLEVTRLDDDFYFRGVCAKRG